MRIVLTLFLFCVCMSVKAQQQYMTEMKKAIDLMQEMYDITFVYDSSLVTTKPQSFPLAGNSLKENLERIFGGIGIKWEIRDEYVLLFRPNNYTFSGYVCEDSGETLINVTILDLNTLKGTLSNAHGFFSITLPEGKHKLRFSYIGYQDVVKEVDLTSNYNGVIYLKESNTSLKEVVVVADLNAPLRTTQTGKVSLTSEQLNTEFSNDVFASDNGLAMGQNGLIGKQSLYEHSVGVPMAIITPDGLSSGKCSDALCYLYDLYPTLCDLMGLDVPVSVTGKSLKPVMEGKQEQIREQVFLAYSNQQRAVVSGDYKYIIYNVEGKITEQLFNLQKDPGELVNLADELTEKKNELHDLLMNQMVENHDFCDLTQPLWWKDGHKLTWDELINLYVFE